MRRACIDIGSNTTRLLVAERDPVGGGVREVATERQFTAIGAAAGPDGTLPPALITAVVAVVVAQVASARRLGAGTVRTVASAAIRHAPNREALVAALDAAGVELEVLAGEREAELAFAGAVASLPARPPGLVAVIDVGGGSTEVAVGRAGAPPGWSASLRVGSSSLTRLCVRRDPPSPDCLASLREAAREAFAGVSPPAGAELVLAVGGSATSLLVLGDAHAGDGSLDERSLRRALAILTAGPVAETAAGLGLPAERVRVLPAGITLLARAGLVFATPLRIARGGLREGVILELLG